jgi:hypothetical protein
LPLGNISNKTILGQRTTTSSLAPGGPLIEKKLWLTMVLGIPGKCLCGASYQWFSVMMAIAAISRHFDVNFFL